VICLRSFCPKQKEPKIKKQGPVLRPVPYINKLQLITPENELHKK
jgi:hypothetical protein